jgi:putative membrane protein
MRKIAAILLVSALAAGTASAHGLPADGEATRWTFDPWVTAFLIAIGSAYFAGLARLHWRARPRRLRLEWRALAFAAGWLSLAGAVTSPLHWLGERLLTFHMIEHEILMAVAAPLLVMARPIGVMLWALPRRMRRSAGEAMRRPVGHGAWRVLTNGANATILHGIAIWAWHAPVLFDVAAADTLIHRLQHLSFVATAVLFWWSVFWRSPTGVAGWHVFVTMLHTSALGALMALAPRMLYRTEPATLAAWRLTPLDDQQLAGIVMWVPAGTIYAGAALYLMAIWIGQASKQARKHHVAHAS